MIDAISRLQNIDFFWWKINRVQLLSFARYIWQIAQVTIPFLQYFWSKPHISGEQVVNLYK